MTQTLGLLCVGCDKYIEFYLPVTFASPPLCEACELEAQLEVESGARQLDAGWTDDGLGLYTYADMHRSE